MPFEAPSPPPSHRDPRPAPQAGPTAAVDAQLLVFRLDDRRFALPAGAVERVLPMMAWAPLPGAPEVVAGVVDVAGRILPVFDLRRRFALPAREPLLSDVLVLVRAGGRSAALPADGVDGLLKRAPAAVTPAPAIAAGLRHVEGVVSLDDGVAFIHDVDAFLSAAEGRQLDRALDARGTAA